MEEDAEALEKMYADILSVYPPGPMRAFWLAQLRRAALLTWPRGRDRCVMSLCEPWPPSAGRGSASLGRHRRVVPPPAQAPETTCAVFGAR